MTTRFLMMLLCVLCVLCVSTSSCPSLLVGCVAVCGVRILSAQIILNKGPCCGVDPCMYTIEDRVTVLYYDNPVFENITDKVIRATDRLCILHVSCIMYTPLSLDTGGTFLQMMRLQMVIILTAILFLVLFACCDADSLM